MSLVDMEDRHSTVFTLYLCKEYFLTSAAPNHGYVEQKTRGGMTPWK